MSTMGEIHEKLGEMGIKPKDSLGIELTVCQFIVVVLSIISIVFLFVPIFFLQDVRFLLLFFSISLLCLGVGVWFWIKKADICEHPEEYQ